MGKTNINIQIDTQLKENAENLFESLGTNMTCAITMFLKSAINHNGTPFEIALEPPYNSQTCAALNEYEDMKANPEKYKRYNSFNEAIDEVLKDT